MILDIKDLMVGDIVSAKCSYENADGDTVTELHPFRITDISVNRLLADGQGNWNQSFLGEWLDDCKMEEIEDICPMEITVDILKANGFAPIETTINAQRLSRLDKDGNNIWFEHCDGKFQVSVHYPTNAFIMSAVPVKYIYELQHILRCMGEKYLANCIKL